VTMTGSARLEGLRSWRKDPHTNPVVSAPAPSAQTVPTDSPMQRLPRAQGTLAKRQGHHPLEGETREFRRLTRLSEGSRTTGAAHAAQAFPAARRKQTDVGPSRQTMPMVKATLIPLVGPLLARFRTRCSSGRADSPVHQIPRVTGVALAHSTLHPSQGQQVPRRISLARPPLDRHLAGIDPQAQGI